MPQPYYIQIAQTSTASTQPNSTPASAINPPAIGFATLIFSAFVILTAIAYRRHRVRHQAIVLKRQIAMLEAMWRISSTK